jgi:hypothetical protein
MISARLESAAVGMRAVIRSPLTVGQHVHQLTFSNLGVHCLQSGGDSAGAGG